MSLLRASKEKAVVGTDGKVHLRETALRMERKGVGGRRQTIFVFRVSASSP